MTKREERNNPASCLQKADEEETIFVLLARDIAAPLAIREWVNQRVRVGSNKFSDTQMQDALATASRMENERLEREKRKRHIMSLHGFQLVVCFSCRGEFGRSTLYQTGEEFFCQPCAAKILQARIMESRDDCRICGASRRKVGLTMIDETGVWVCSPCLTQTFQAFIKK